MTITNKEIEYDVGGVWEYPEWSILLEHIAGVPSMEDLAGTCDHVEWAMEESSPPGGYKRLWIFIPRVVKAWNEGGYATTGVCLDCILEKAQRMPKTHRTILHPIEMVGGST